MNQSDRDFIIQTIERLINAPIRTLTNAEIARLKGLIKKICIVIMLEIIVGIIMYYGSFPLMSQPIHLFLATILFGYQFYWFLHFTKIRK